jgi:hypothetical protein
MNIYRTHLRAPSSQTNSGASEGYTYFANLKDAKREQRASNKASKHSDTIAVIKVKMPITKAEMIRVLNTWGADPDNG